MAEKKKIVVPGLNINVSEINKVEYISLTNIAKRTTDTKPALVIQR